MNKFDSLNSKNSILTLIGGFIPISIYLINTDWKEIDFFTLFGFTFLMLLGIVFFIYHVKTTKEISFSEKHIYIKPIFSSNFETVNYSDVIELKEIGVYLSIHTTRTFSLKYISGNSRRKTHFYSKLDGKLLELKRLIEEGNNSIKS